MLRLRLILLALASGMLMTLTGCRSTSCDEGRLFPRLFHNTSRARTTEGMDCECQKPGWPAGVGVPSGQGPFIFPGAGMPSNPSIPITNVNTPPSLLKVPSATPTPFVP